MGCATRPTPMARPDSVDAVATGNETILQVRGLCTQIQVPGGVLRVLDGVDISVGRGRTVCIVGESGCGKSMTARSIMRLVPPPLRMVGGEILLRGKDGLEVDLVH